MCDVGFYRDRSVIVVTLFHGKPILGVAGGIGSGKSFVARCFERYGWVVINSDDIAREVYAEPQVLAALRDWWGESIFDADGKVRRGEIAKLIFNHPPERTRLEALIHPAVDAMRQRKMATAADDPNIMGFVWDTPLLFETGLNHQCDWVVFVDAPIAVREARVRANRGWAAGELSQREISQLPLDTKRTMSQDVIHNATDESDVLLQIKHVLSRISERLKVRTIRPAGSV